MITKSKSWFGRTATAQPFQVRAAVVERQVVHIRILKSAPYKVSYADFTYSIQTVVDETANVSYVAARMVNAQGRLMQPLHEYELSRRFQDAARANEVWSTGFEPRGDSFVSRALIRRMIDEQAAEEIPAPSRGALPESV